ncbi:MAG TPA: hypothetical protein VGC85_08030 [Chthoniobacterales bacterium]|jgi:hypothetical protein
MKTTSQSYRVASLSVWCVAAVAAIAFCGSTLADSSKDGPVSAKQARVEQKAPRKTYYIQMGSSGIPQPCERFAPVPTTASPMEIIGELPTVCTGKPAR